MGMTIAVAGTGYVGLSLAVLLAQHNRIIALDVLADKVDAINRRESPIRDEKIEDYLSNRKLDPTATLGAEEAYRMRTSLSSPPPPTMTHKLL